MDNIDLTQLKSLIIDDNDFVRFSVKKVLTSFDFLDVFEASNGEGGLLIVKNEKPDIVVCDINMKIMSGFQFLQSVRIEDSISGVKTPIIFLTSYADEKFVKKAKDMKVDAYLLKPVTGEQLRSKIEALLSLRKVET